MICGFEIVTVATMSVSVESHIHSISFIDSGERIPVGRGSERAHALLFLSVFRNAKYGTICSLTSLTYLNYAARLPKYERDEIFKKKKNIEKKKKT